jgi:uncharacterized Zn finger protein
METISTISKDEIRARVGERSFERGMQYFLSGAIFETRQQGATLKARCHGSQGGPYRLEVTLNAEGVARAHCSCPVGSGGYCKHTAALLLTWLERPEQFAEREEPDAALERRSKAELIALIKQMLRQEPELEWLLETPLPAAGKRQEPVDAAVYRRQAAALFGGDDYREWKALDDVVEGLLAIKEIGDGFAAQEDDASAAAVYSAILGVTLKNYETYQDDDGELGSVIGQCVEGLGECLGSEEGDTDRRELILKELWDVYRFDVNLGGRGLGDEAGELLLEKTTPEERRVVAGWVREAMPEGGDWSGNWRREVFGGFLLDLEAETLDDKTFLEVCRQTGRAHDLVDRLLSLGRVDEAVAAAEQVSDYRLIDLADLFIEHGYAPMADTLMRERAEKTDDSRVLEWLKQRYIARGDNAAALKLADRIFRKLPSLAGYQEIRSLTQSLGRWESLRPELMALLDQPQHSHLVVQIYLDEGEIDQALQAVKSQRSSYGTGGWYRYDAGMRLKVAEAAEEPRPRAALEIYRQEIEGLIAGRGRENYQTACQLLLRVRTLYERLGESGTWTAYIAALREQNRSLPALKQELAAAGL